MCSSDFSLKLIAGACLLIIVTDSFVMQQILEKEQVIHMTSDPDIYQSCYKPQIRMRVIFTAYAILSASVCFVLTLALMVCDEFSEWFDKIVNGVAEFMYVSFGPVLFTFCLFGLFSIPELAHECHPHYISSNLNLMDITILLICSGLSFCIVFIYALQHTNRVAEKDLGDEHSIFYQLFSTFLNRTRHRYHVEKKRRIALRNHQYNGGSNCGNNQNSERHHFQLNSNMLDELRQECDNQNNGGLFSDRQQNNQSAADGENIPLKQQSRMSAKSAAGDLSEGASNAGRSTDDRTAATESYSGL